MSEHQDVNGQLLADDLTSGMTLAWGEAGWRHIELVEHIDPRPMSLPYVKIRSRDDKGEIRDFTLPAALNVMLREPTAEARITRHE